MKYIINILAGILLITYISEAQLIYTDPEFPTMGQLITVYYNTSLDPGELKDFTGDL